MIRIVNDIGLKLYSENSPVRLSMKQYGFDFTTVLKLTKKDKH